MFIIKISLDSFDCVNLSYFFVFVPHPLRVFVLSDFFFVFIYVFSSSNSCSLLHSFIIPFIHSKNSLFICLV